MSIHNPDNVPHPGNGYRFLDVEEVKRERPSHPDIHYYEGDGIWDRSGWSGMLGYRTFRTSLTREQLREYDQQSEQSQ